MKVLILGVAAVQLDAIEELKKMGHETFAVAMAKDGPGADAADHFDLINIIDEEKIINYINDNSIDAVYSTGSDLAMPVSCRISEKLSLPHFVPSNVASICNHKNEMRECLGEDCPGNIPFQVFDNCNTINIEFPVIAKPSDSQGQRGVKLIHNQEEFELQFDDIKQYSREGKVIVEKFIDGPEISVNGYMFDGNLIFFLASDRVTWEEYTGLIHKHVLPTKSISKKVENKLRETFEIVCNRIGITNGPVYSQVKIMDNHPYIIEITPRLDGCHMWRIIKYACGLNLMELTFQHLLNNDVSEINKLVEKTSPMELVFWCQKPNTEINLNNYIPPNSAVHHYYYYQNNMIIRPVNGVFEKIGYYIHEL